jgi:hypothetical protein
MSSEQDTRTAATVILDWLDDHGFRGADTDELQLLSAALAQAGYTIAGPGQVCVDRDRWERVRDTAECHWTGKGRYHDMRRGDLNPLSTQEGE